jgi:hypothetical protein
VESRRHRAGLVRGIVAAVAAMLLLATAATAAASSGSLSLRGTTSQQQPVQFKLQLSRTGGKLSGIFRYVETCEVAGPLKGHLTTPFSRVSVARSGRFHVGSGNAGTLSLGNGYTGSLQLKVLTGRVENGGDKAVGAFDIAMVVTDGEGNTVDHCDTHTVHFNAKR